MARRFFWPRSHLRWYRPSSQTPEHCWHKAGRQPIITLSPQSRLIFPEMTQTDHNVGKMARNAHQNPDFIVLGGASDYLM